MAAPPNNPDPTHFPLLLHSNLERLCYWPDCLVIRASSTQTFSFLARFWCQSVSQSGLGTPHAAATISSVANWAFQPNLRSHQTAHIGQRACFYYTLTDQAPVALVNVAFSGGGELHNPGIWLFVTAILCLLGTLTLTEAPAKKKI